MSHASGDDTDGEDAHMDPDDVCAISGAEWLLRSMPLYLAKYGTVQTQLDTNAEGSLHFQSADEAFSPSRRPPFSPQHNCSPSVETQHLTHDAAPPHAPRGCALHASSEGGASALRA